MFPEERRDLPGVDCLPGQLGSRVMAARQPNYIQIDSMRLYFGDYLARQIERKGQVVTRGDETDRPLFYFQQSRNERHRANGLPKFAQLVDRQVGFDPFTYVLCRDSLPDNIGNIT